ncbi:MAG: DUF983 domain-containing protein [Chitinophagaceae bacterium]
MKKKGLLKGILGNQCPRCRRGDLFITKNPYRLKHLFSMYDRCPVCGQKIMLQPDFWYISNYITYALCAVFSVFTLLLYWVIIGITWRDNSFFHWMVLDLLVLALLLPLIIRLSRTIYLHFFVTYDPMTLEPKGRD